MENEGNHPRFGIRSLGEAGTCTRIWAPRFFRRITPIHNKSLPTVQQSCMTRVFLPLKRDMIPVHGRLVCPLSATNTSLGSAKLIRKASDSGPREQDEAVGGVLPESLKPMS